MTLKSTTAAESPMQAAKHPLDVCLIIPCYNEARRLPATINLLRKHIDKSTRRWEVLFVDDGSRDQTAAIAASAGPPFLAISLPQNCGKGAAVRAGILAAKASIVGYTDADLPFPFDYFEHAVQLIDSDSAEMVCGDRTIPGTDKGVRRPPLRRLASRVFRAIRNVVLPTSIEDTQCPMKFLRRDLAQSLFEPLALTGYAFDVEVIGRAQRFGYRLKSIAVPTIRFEDSRVNVWKQAVPMLRDILATRARLASETRSLRPIPEKAAYVREVA